VVGGEPAETGLSCRNEGDCLAGLDEEFKDDESEGIAAETRRATAKKGGGNGQ